MKCMHRHGTRHDAATVTHCTTQTHTNQANCPNTPRQNHTRAHTDCTPHTHLLSSHVALNRSKRVNEADDNRRRWVKQVARMPMKKAWWPGVIARYRLDAIWHDAASHSSLPPLPPVPVYALLLVYAAPVNHRGCHWH